jgi:hypothetical protein
MRKSFFSNRKMFTFSTIIALLIFVACGENVTDNNYVEFPVNSTEYVNELASELDESYNLIINLEDLYLEGDIENEFSSSLYFLNGSCECDSTCKFGKSGKMNNGKLNYGKIKNGKNKNGNKCDTCQCDSLGKKHNNGKGNGNYKNYKNYKPGFCAIFNELNLTDEQAKTISSFAQEHKNCRREAIDALREAQRAILQNANLERKKIIDDMKNGTITATEARELLLKLAEQVRQDMNNSSEVQAALEAVKNCHNVFIDNISSVLTADQLVIWNKFLETIK